MDSLKENGSFILCSIGSVYCMYHLIKISIENHKSVSNYVPQPKIIRKKSPKDIIKQESNNTHNGTPKLPALNSSRLQILQRKLDVYVNDLKVRKESIFKEPNTESYVYKICLTGGPNAGKTTSK